MKMKKKKSNTFNKILISLVLLFSSSQNLNAKDNCVKFYEDLENNFNIYKPNDYPMYLYNDFGFDFKFKKRLRVNCFCV